jgi:hypothetical protein
MQCLHLFSPDGSGTEVKRTAGKWLAGMLQTIRLKPFGMPFVI